MSNSNAKAWRLHGDDIRRALLVELEQAPTGAIFRESMERQVQLIRSLPLNAAEQVHEWTTEAMTDGTRVKDIMPRVMALGDMTKARAQLIARTEVARTASTLTQARARYVGSEGYIWRTSGDGDVRPTHRAQNGKFIYWDRPPKTDKNLAPYHAGCGPNCRCYPDPVLPE